MAMPVDLSLEDYWRIIRRRSWLILFAFGTTVALTAAFTMTQDPVYSSFATLKIEPPAGETGVGGAFSQWDSWTGVNTELKVLETAAVVELALRRLQRLNDKTPPGDAGAMIGDALGRMSAQRIGDTSMVKVIVEGPSPADAASLAQAISDVYMEQDIVSRRRKNELALANITRRKAQIETVLHDLEEEKRRMIEDAPVGAMAVANLAGRVLDLENQRSVLLDQYTDAHPDVVKLSKEIEVLTRKLKEFPKDALEIARVERDVRINDALYNQLAREYEQQRVASASVVALASLVSRALENPHPVRPNRPANMAFGASLGLVLGLILAFLAENLDTSLVSVEDVEKTLEMPVLGLIPHILPPGGRETQGFFSRLRPWKRSPLDDRRERMVIHAPAHAPAIEAYHSLRTGLEGMFPETKGAALVFTSCAMSEGKTLSVVNFALAAVQVGARVLIVDGDLRRPALHRMLGVENDLGLTDAVLEGKPVKDALKGVTDLMAGSARIEDLLKTPGLDNLSLLTAGAIKANPVEVFKRREFVQLLDELRPEFDWIIFDCPPLLLFADGLILGPQVDGVVLFYQFGRMARSALKRARDELLAVQAKPLGIVINDVQPKELEPRYGYYKYNYYYEEYAKEDNDK